jgi:cytochrome c oxidase assembly factor CtaG
MVAIVAVASTALALAPAATAHGDQVPESEVWTRWTFEPIPVVAGAVAVALFLQGWSRLRARGRTDHAGFDRLALFLGGIAVVLVGIVSPLDPIAEEYLQSAHMLQHVLIADVGVALTVVAMRGPLTVFFLPRPILVLLARSRAVRRSAAAITRPAVTVLAWVTVLVVWHIPRLYDEALANVRVHDLQHLSFVVVGTLVWIQLVDPMRHRRLTIGERIGLAAVVFWVGQILAYVVVFDPKPLFTPYVDQDERLLGLSPLTDQKIAGVLMMVEQLLTIGTCLLILVGQARRQRVAGAGAPRGELPV